ncbi:MAG TPA: hypothetical protein VH988_16300 [Thermoanaerobaculia bacterium]|jgi:hypothetical protein|nr:hypothetical protein [Thermoanaerobaculia bacterium]
MRFRWLAVFPLIYAALFSAVAAWLGSDPHALQSFMTDQRIVVRILSAVGCCLAVSVFARGDHLRRAWLCLGWAAVLILLRDVLRLFPPFQAGGSGGMEAQAFLSGLGILSNVALLAGIWELARSWKMAAIELPGGRAGVFAVAAVTAVLALVVAGPGALEHGRAVVAGDWGSLIFFVSAVADILSLCLITPLLLTAVSLRGGLFFWPWALVTASQVCWLLYDAAGTLAPHIAPRGFPLAEVFRGMAESYLFVAGVVQFLLIRHVRRAAG